MAAYFVSPRVVRLGCLRGWRRAFTPNNVCAEPGNEIDEQRRKPGANPHHGFLPQRGYRLHHNLSSCHHAVCNSLTSQGQTDNDEHEQCLSTLASSFWQQSHHSYTATQSTVSGLQHFSSSKNTLPDLDFSKDPEPRVKINTRAFHKCRPEYASMVHVPTHPAHSSEHKEALCLLKKVSLLKGKIQASEISELFVKLRHMPAHMASEMRCDQDFITFLEQSVEKLAMFSNPELLGVLRSFVCLNISPTHPVLGPYENELNRRASKMTVHQLLFCADLWRCIRRQVPQFLQKLYDCIDLHVGEMGTPELVQLLYIIGEGRYCPQKLIGPIQRALLRHLHQMHPEEIGVVCLALFKSQTSMPYHVIIHIINRAHSHLKEMSDFAFVNVLKLLRFSYLYDKQWMEAMAHEIPLRAPKMGISGLMHTTLFCSAYHHQNWNILTSVADRVLTLVPHCRSKDSSKLLWSFGTLQFPPDQSPSFYPSLIESLRSRKDDFHQYPQHLISGLLGLAFVSVFPEDLLALALSPDFVKRVLTSEWSELSKDLFALDGTVALELPHWTGPRLSSEFREEITGLLWNYAETHVCPKPEFQEAESVLVKLLGGEKFVCRRMILPHTRTIDLEVHFDSNGAPIPINTAFSATTLSTENRSNQAQRVNVGVPITEELLTHIMGTKSTPGPLTPHPQPGSLCILEPDDKIEALAKVNSPAPQDTTDTVKLAIQVFRRRHHSFNSLQLLGIQAMKRRQLKSAGYKVVELSYHEWSQILRRSRAEKLAYMHCKVYGSL